MKREQRTGFSFFLQILLLLFFFLGVCTILLQAFAGAAVLSRRARAENDGTELCRNAAEAFAATGTLDGTLELLGADAAQQEGPNAGMAELHYDVELCLTAGGCYTLRMETQQEATAAGALAKAHFTVTNAAGETCAQLDTETYLSNARKEGGADAA